MPTTLTAPEQGTAPMDPQRKVWTRTECDLLDQAGVIDQQRLELVEGELINKMGKKRPQVNALGLMMGWLNKVFGDRFILQEAPIDVFPEDNPTNEPEPEAVVLKRPFPEFLKANPKPQDLNLVIEVADTSLYFDLTKKAELYARAEIIEYWVLDVSERRRMFVHREPRDGKYQSVKEYTAQERVSPLAASDAQFFVGSAFAGE